MLTNEEKFNYFKKECERFIAELSDTYNTPIPKLSFKQKEDRFVGHYDYEDNEIVIDLRKVNNGDELTIAILHEFRHHWQWYHHRDYYIWWIEDKHYDFYNSIYPYPTIETDALRFSMSFGKKDDLEVFKCLPRKKLEEYYNTNKELLEKACHVLFDLVLEEE